MPTMPVETNIRIVWGEEEKAVPKILVNATTLVVGGGVQIGISFVEYAARLDCGEFNLLFCLSRNVYDGLPGELRSDTRVVAFDVSPARIVSGHSTRAHLKRLERSFRPDIVYTLGLPSYIRFKSPEVGRYTNPWEIEPTRMAWSSIPLRERLQVWLKSRYRRWWACRAAFFETQTESAKSGIMRRLRVPGERIVVIPNAPNPVFITASEPVVPKPEDACLRIFCLAAAYRHKNLGIIPHVADRLRRRIPQVPFKFLLTVPHDNRIGKEIARSCRNLGLEEIVENVGQIKMSECVRRYKESDIVFLPTLLEVFSATYVEAMAMARPIVTTDLDFAHDVCGDAALYYSPDSADDAADAIARLALDPGLRQAHAEKGRLRLETFPAPQMKHRMVMDWLGKVVQGIRERI